MKIRIHDLMVQRVITAQPHHTVQHVRNLMRRNNIHAVPVVASDGEPIGILTSSDLVEEIGVNTPVNRVMTEGVYKVPAYNDVQVAARVMRKHRIHHVIVTHEQKLIGIISSFDLLKLIESNAYTVVEPRQPNKQRARTSAQKHAREMAKKSGDG